MPRLDDLSRRARRVEQAAPVALRNVGTTGERILETMERVTEFDERQSA